MSDNTASINSFTETKIPSTGGMTTKVVKGSFWTLAGQILPLVVSFVATPFVIRLLGAEQYGVFALINLLSSHLIFADFGMSLASTNYASGAVAKGSEEEEGEIVRAAVLITLLSSVATSLIVILLAKFIVSDLLQIPPHLENTAIIAIYISCITLTARMLSGVLNSPQLARLRMDLNSSINAVFNVAQLIAVPIVLFFGGGILGGVLTIMVAAIAAVITHVIVSGSLSKRLFEFSINVHVVRSLLRFGVTLAAALAAGVLLANLEKVILTRYTSVTVFAYYTVAFTLANMVTLFSASIAQSLVPAFSQLYAAGKSVEMQDLYSRTITLNLILFAPVAMMLCLIAKPFFTIWAGEDFGRESTFPFYVLILGLLFGFAASVAGTIMVAVRKTKVSAILCWSELLPYLLLAGIMTFYWGAVGAALAWSIRVIFETAALLILVKKIAGLSFNLFEKKIIYLMLSFVFLFVPPILVNIFNLYYGFIALLTAVSLISYAFLVWHKVISVEEQNFLKNNLSGFTKRYFNF